MTDTDITAALAVLPAEQHHSLCGSMVVLYIPIKLADFTDTVVPTTRMVNGIVIYEVSIRARRAVHPKMDCKLRSLAIIHPPRSITCAEHSEELQLFFNSTPSSFEPLLSLTFNDTVYNFLRDMHNHDGHTTAHPSSYGGRWGIDTQQPAPY
jgi:hypothetical protein